MRATDQQRCDSRDEELDCGPTQNSRVTLKVTRLAMSAFQPTRIRP
ncbi:hypothetical protein GA0070610_5687 [Micromonospora echinofusca]|uniref:Uncharacterized protein n=1 Tax=Micromonospora echinofusca TaxID=47858 RepID=A0A1C5GHT2_MICEH|nr:hypothetical protein GA0070610_5687 [Micromonospora echinofusca]